MRVRRTVAASAATALVVAGATAVGSAAVAESATEEYVPVEDIVATANSDEETEHYNEWHLDPDNEGAAPEQQPNGLVAKEDSRVLVLKGNGNDSKPADEDVSQSPSLDDVTEDLDIVASSDDAVTYQIAVRFNYDEENDSWGWSTLRAAPDSDQWTSSKAIPLAPGAPETAQAIEKDVAYDYNDIKDALDSWEDSRIIGSGFLVYEPSDDVLVSSFTSNDTTTRFYDEPTVSDGFEDYGPEIVVDAEEIGENGNIIPGWHNGATGGTFEILKDEAGFADGIEMEGEVQIINGLVPDNTLWNRLDLAESLHVSVAEGSDTVWAQVPLYAFPEGQIAPQYTTLRAPVPASGDLADAETWVSSRQITGADNEVLVAKDAEYTFDELKEKLDGVNNVTLAYGFYNGVDATSVVRDVTFDGFTTKFYEVPLADVYAPAYEDLSVVSGQSGTADISFGDDEAPEAKYSVAQSPEGWDVSVDDKGQVSVDVPAGTEAGESTITVDVAYDDESSEQVDLTVTVAAAAADGYAPVYEDLTIVAGQARSADISFGDEDAPEAKYSLDEAPEGWTVTVDEATGHVNVSVPSSAAAKNYDVAVDVAYTDGSADVATLSVTVKPAPVHAKTGNLFFVANSWDTNVADVQFAYGRKGDEVFVGDWDGDGYDTLAVRRGTTFFVKNDLRGGNSDASFTYGRLGDEVLVGDWDGDGLDTFGVRRGNKFYLNNELAGGWADVSFVYGRNTDEVLVGDWDNDSIDTVALRRGSTFHVSNSQRGGWADTTFNYGRVSDDAFAGDFDGDGYDTVSLRRGNVFYVSNALQGGNAETEIAYGRASDSILIGDWNGDGVDSPAVNRYVAK